MREKLRRVLVEKGVFTHDLAWQKLLGGRSNQVWRVGTEFVCKFYLKNTNPLFQNSGAQEGRALQHVAPLSIGPQFHSLHKFDFGEVLIYRHLDGENWHGDVQSVAHALKLLHSWHTCEVRFEETTTEHDIETSARKIFDLLSDVKHQRLVNLRPSVCAPADGRRVLLHGDVVPSNMIETSSGLRLIDWQSPALGDPLMDIARFLSPSMQISNGYPALSQKDVDAFFHHYDDEIVKIRYKKLAPLLHWRMALYCGWRLETGDETYRAGLEKELLMLESSA